MSADKPNRIRVRQGETGSYSTFGDVCSVHPIHITNGAGHVPHLSAHFIGGVELCLTPAALVHFIREAQAALAKLPRQFQHVADHVGGDQ